MVKVKIRNDEVYLDGFLQKKLDNVKTILEKNWDCVFIIDGRERVGKSTLGITIGSYLYPKMNVHNVASDSADAVNKIESLPDKSVLLIDEGSLVLSSRDSMRKEQRRILKILNVVGQRNMVFIICLPSFFELTKYIATTRARFMLHCYSDAELQRGRFAYWGTHKLNKLYSLGRKNFGSYQKPSADFVGRFTKYEPEWYHEYLQTKKKSLYSALHDDDKVLTEQELMKKCWVKVVRNINNVVPELSRGQKAQIIEVSTRSISRYSEEIKDM